MNSAATPGRMVIHVGAPKTGSTYIQKRLRVDPCYLRSAGIYVPVHPKTERMAGNAKLLATAFLGNPSASFARAFPNIDVANLQPSDVLNELLSGWQRNTETIVLSAENFRSSHAMRLREILPPDINPTPILFVRRQDEWFESYYNQLIKTRDIMDDLPSFIEKICAADDGRFCHPDWFAHYNAWKEAFGTCQVAFFEEARSDIFTAFLEAARLPKLPNLPEIDRKQVSLSPYQLAYLFELNQDIPFAEFITHRKASEKAAKQYGASEKLTFLAPNTRMELLEQFQESNQKLFHALGRRDGDSIFDLSKTAATYIPLEDFLCSSDYLRFKGICNAISNESGADR
jgi:hypothetical protein